MDESRLCLVLSDSHYHQEKPSLMLSQGDVGKSRGGDPTTTS